MSGLVLGDLQVTLPGHVAGWCMLPDQPLARATVEVLVDGQHDMRVLAAGRGNDPGDGRHGFYARLKVPIEGKSTRVIEAREAGTGSVFGRVVLFPERIAQPMTERLAALDCAPLHDAGIGTPDRLGPALLGGFRALAAELRGLSGPAWRREAHRLARGAPLLRVSETPKLSLIVPTAPSVESTLERLADLHTICREDAAEILAVDDGADPRAVLLPGLVPGLRYSREADRSAGATLNQLALAARGDMLCFLAEAVPAWPWQWPWRDMKGAGDPFVHLGPAFAPARAGWRPVTQRSKPHGVAIALPRARFIEAGGFDTSLRGNAAFADMAFKCGKLGVPAIAWRYQGGALSRKGLLF